MPQTFENVSENYKYVPNTTCYSRGKRESICRAQDSTTRLEKS